MVCMKWKDEKCRKNREDKEEEVEIFASMVFSNANQFVCFDLNLIQKIRTMMV